MLIISHNYVLFVFSVTLKVARLHNVDSINARINPNTNKKRRTYIQMRDNHLHTPNKSQPFNKFMVTNKEEEENQNLGKWVGVEYLNY